MKGSKSIERSNSTSKSKKTITKDSLPPIRADSIDALGSGASSKSNSRSATPAAEPSTSTQILPPIRPVSATKLIDSTTRVQLQEQLRDKSGTSDPVNFVDGENEGQVTQDDIAAEDHYTGKENEVIDSVSDTLICSGDSQTEIEDPEKQYWRIHSGPPKNSSNVAKEALKRIQTAVASKKMDLSEMDLIAIPEKVFLNNVTSSVMYLYSLLLFLRHSKH